MKPSLPPGQRDIQSIRVELGKMCRAINGLIEKILIESLGSHSTQGPTSKLEMNLSQLESRIRTRSMKLMSQGVLNPAELKILFSLFNASVQLHRIGRYVVSLQLNAADVSVAPQAVREILCAISQDLIFILNDFTKSISKFEPSHEFDATMVQSWMCRIEPKIKNAIFSSMDREGGERPLEIWQVNTLFLAKSIEHTGNLLVRVWRPDAFYIETPDSH